MYRVMVVDDEAAHRKGMVQILNAIKPDYFLLEARDGSMAEMVLNTVDVDIILTDIRMPNKDGLEFLADLYSQRHHAKVIIVSGYGQFSYAKTALANGAFDFLLKPIDLEELEAVLERAEKSIEEDEKRKQRQNRYIDLLLVKMVKSELSDGEKEQLHGVLPEEGAGLIFCIKTKKKTYAEAEFIELRQIIKQKLNPWGHTIMFGEIDSSVSWAGMLFLHYFPDRGQELSVLESIRDAIREVLPREMSFGLSSIAQCLYTETISAYQQASAALSRSFYDPDSGVIYTGDVEETSQKILRLLSEKEDEIANLIRYNGHPEILKELSELFAWISSDSMPNPNRLKELFVLQGMRVANLLQKKGVIADYHQMLAAFTKKVMNAGSLDELRREVENIFLFLNDISRQGAQEEDAILLAVRYLEEHFAEEIALTDVAEKFFFTPAYFSIYFKKRTGELFSQYLKNIRMKRACEMLTGTQKKVSKIALETGYSDSAYFGKVFKKHMGCSPEEYRKRNYRI